MGKSAEELRAQELRRDIAYARTDLGETIDAIEDRVSPGRIIERRKNRFSNGLHSVRDRVMGTATYVTFETRDRMAESAGSTKDKVSDAAHHAADSAKTPFEAARRETQGSPLVAGAIALGVGFLAAAAFPSSRTERDAAGRLMDKAEPLKEKATEMGRQVADDLKGEAKHAADEVMQTAKDGAQHVKDSAKESSEHVKDSAKEAQRTTNR